MSVKKSTLFQFLSSSLQCRIISDNSGDAIDHKKRKEKTKDDAKKKEKKKKKRKKEKEKEEKRKY